jgi:hypothetical protein
MTKRGKKENLFYINKHTNVCWGHWILSLTLHVYITRPCQLSVLVYRAANWLTTVLREKKYFDKWKKKYYTTRSLMILAWNIYFCVRVCVSRYTSLLSSCVFKYKLYNFTKKVQQTQAVTLVNCRWLHREKKNYKKIFHAKSRSKKRVRFGDE